MSAGVALVHLASIAIGAPAYRYLGVGEIIADLARRGSPLVAMVSAVLGLVSAMFALYALSGAGVLRPLPLLRTGLVAIGLGHALSGAIGIPQILQLGAETRPPAFRSAVFSGVNLTIGLLYLIGVARRWKALSIMGAP
ncbi:MAG: hypothetical protein HY076_03510 [Candidatus Eisenbacteria bacterium]|uniref:Uncharacterized protein n=1 Tax=Eiseniibacteriota bacterium TaxID=2212470 RepID=A0A9D6L3W2_UNCEI|nr:hypothetical protein [Candidatus Eisenbacteria bacterium]